MTAAIEVVGSLPQESCQACVRATGSHQVCPWFKLCSKPPKAPKQSADGGSEPTTANLWSSVWWWLKQLVGPPWAYGAVTVGQC